MKVIVLHGDDIDKSYKRLTAFVNEAKKRHWEILYDEISETPSLFGNDRLTVIRDYKIYRKQKFIGTTVFYHEGTLPQTFLKSLPKDTKIEKFDLPKKIWSFLDHMTIEGLHDLIKTEAIEFVFVMIVWKIKKKQDPVLMEKLAEIDYKVKTGKGDLLSLLDLFILKHLQ